MKATLLLFAVLAVAMGPAQALRCHVCNNSANCNNPKDCPASSRFCRTINTVEPLSGNLVKKDCVDWCTPSSIQPGQVSSGAGSTQCCQSDLCNGRLSSAAPTRALLSSATLGLVVALGLLAPILVPHL
nr:lymphocyte antigen 6D [Castor canadensis]